jgi:hypothetical protein
MSVLLPPRLVFQGTTAWSPNTINNLPAAYDKRRVAACAGQTEWLKELNEDGTDVCGGWNLNGANDCAFPEVAITGIQLAGDAMLDADDPLIGCAVRIAGALDPATGRRGPARIVDVDPKHPITAQIFFESFSVGDEQCGFEGSPHCRMSVRWPVLERNLNQTGGLIRAGCAAVLWQTALPRETLAWHGLDRSRGLRALKQALDADKANRGLVVRFTNYRTSYYQTATWKGVRLTNPELLSAAYRDGFTGPNPALSMTLGSIGIWRAGELASGPSERLLTPCRAVTVRECRGGRYISPEFADRADESDVSDAKLGPAFVAVDRGRHVVVLDLSLTFPERDAFLEKADLGSFVLQARREPREVAQIGRPITYADYCRAAYEANAGVLELPFDPERSDFVESGEFELVPQDGPRRRVLREEPLAADSEERGIYLNQGETRTVEIRVAQRGSRPRGPVMLVFAQYGDDGKPLPTRRRVVQLLDAAGRPLRRDVVQVARTGLVRIGLRPRRPGFCFLSFRAAGTVPRVPARFSPRLPYLAVRALPFDDELERRTRDADLSFRFIYDRILRVYDVVYPAMTQPFALRDSRELAAQAELIRSRLSLDAAKSTEFLPVSRDLSAGKRKLLLRFLDLPPDREPPDPRLTASRRRRPSPTRRRSGFSLTRKHQSG